MSSYKKEQNQVSCSEKDELRVCHTEKSKSEREKQILYINRYIWNLEKWYWWTYMQGRNRERLLNVRIEFESLLKKYGLCIITDHLNPCCKALLLFVQDFKNGSVFSGYFLFPSLWCFFLIVVLCREPAWGTLPVAKVMMKEARHTQRRDRASGVPLEILEHLPPKPESAYFAALCSHLHLWLYGGLSPTTSLGEGVNLELQVIKFLGMTRVF